MTCAEFQQELPDVLEGVSSAEVEAHLSSCSLCSELVSDLKAISEQASELRASEEPDPRVWQNIEAVLRQEGLIRGPQSERLFLVTPSRRRWGPASWLVPAAAAILVGFVVFLNRPVFDPAAQKSTQPTRVAVSTPPKAAGAADSEDDQQVLSEVEKRAPLMKSVYEDDLKNVNSYIRDAQNSVDQNPDDGEARQYLLEAYEQKAMLYEMALDGSLP